MPVATVKALRSLVRTRFNLQFALGYLINEQPFLGLFWLLSATTTLLQLEVGRPVWWVVTGLCLLDIVVLAALAVRSRSARPALSTALEATFGAGAAPRYTQPVWWRILLMPFVSWRPDVRRIANRHYGPGGRGNRIDVYVSRRHVPSDAPVLLYLHGGAFRIGSKLGARPLLYRLAAQGRICASADYRMFRVDYADQLADTRAALAWLREHAAGYGGSPERIVVAGGSAGAHLGPPPRSPARTWPG